MEDYKSRWEELAEIEEQAKIIETLRSLGIETDDILNMSEEAFAKFKDEYIGILADIYSGNDSMLSALSDTTGRSVDEMGSYITATQGYIDSLSGIGESLNPLSEAIGNVDENMGSLSSTASEANTNLSETASKTNEVATNVGTIADGLNQMPDSQNITNLSGAFEKLAESIGKVAQALGLGEGAEVNTLFQAMDSLNEVTLGSEGEGIIGQFTLLKNAITDVIDTIGLSQSQTVGSLMQAIDQLNSVTLDESIIQQFTNLKEAIDSVSSAISGGGESSGSEGQGGNSGSGDSGKSGGSNSEGSGSGNSLTGAITEMGETANTVIGEPDAEGDGTVIGEFGSLETAVNDVTTAIGGDSESGGNSGGSGEDDSNLIGSIVNLGETTEETLGEPDGDGVTGRFGQFRDVIAEANEQVHGISDGLAAIDGQEVECTIKVNIEVSGGIPAFASGTALDGMNLNSSEYNAQYKGNAHYEGTAKVTGDWGVRAAGKALVGELGQEIVVSSDGKWRTVGDNGAEFVYLKENDIVFNHLQTKELLSKGNLVGRGKAFSDGTAFASGTAHVNGTVNDDAPHYPSQEILDFTERMKRLEMQHELIANNTYGLLSPLHEIKQNTENMISNISNISNVNNKNVQPNINVGGINITCPGITSQEVAKQVGVELNHMFNGFSLYTDQMSRTR